jgi:nitrite reductase/ring-hydroxylating ferredoxin subunit
VSLPTWTQTTLANMAGGGIAHANGLNDAAVIVGAGGDGTYSNRAVKWTSPSTPVALAFLNIADDQSEAVSINGSGDIVGYSGVVGDIHAVIWSGASVAELTQRNAGDEITIAQSINDAGEIVGYSIDRTPNPDVYYALYWANPGAAPTTLWSGDFGAAQAINVSGEIAGFDVDDGIYYDGGAVSLDDLDPGQFSGAYALNTIGDITGESYDSGPDETFAVVWDTSGNVVALDIYDPHSGSYNAAEGVNDNRIACGTGDDSDFNFHAVVWDLSDGSVHLLPDDGNSGDARAINATNYIVGVVSGNQASLWTPPSVAGYWGVLVSPA